MLANWQQLQVQIWEVEAELKHSSPAKEAGYKRLKNLLRYRAQLCLANRLASTASAGNFPTQGFSNSEDLESAIGHESAKAWSTFFECLSLHPRGIPGLSRALGEETFDAFAQISSALVEVPPVASFRSDSAALDKIIESEYLIGALDAASVEDGSLHSGSFLCTLLYSMTVQHPAGQSWMQAVIHREPNVGETVRKFLYPTPNISKDEACESLQSAVKVIVTSLCDHAAVAPQGLCSLTFALQSELGKLKEFRNTPSDKFRELRNALIGEIIIGKWLVCQYYPGDNAKPWINEAYTAFSKSLTAVCANNPDSSKGNKLALAASDARLCNHGHSAAELLSGVSDAFVQREAKRLASGFFDVLITRGHQLIGKDEISLPWPRCVAWTVGHLVELAQKFIDIDTDTMKAADAAGLTDDLVKALGKTRALVDPKSPITCWLPSSIRSLVRDTPTDSRISISAAVGSGMRASVGGRRSTISALPMGPSETSSHGYDEMLFGKSDTIYPGFEQKATRQTHILPEKMVFEMEEKSFEMEEKSRKTAAWEGLLWRVLADPWPVEGPPDSTLLKALQALLRMHQADAAQQRLEQLLGWLEPTKDSNMKVLLPDSASSTSKMRESEMQDNMREKLKKRVQMAKATARDVLQMHVAESLVVQSCSNCLKILKDTASYRTSQLCEQSWRALRDPRQRPPGKERRGLDLCIIRVPIDMVPSGVSENSDPRWVADVVNNAGAKSPSKSYARTSSSSTFSGSSEYRVVLVELHKDPVHAVFTAGAYVGRVRHDIARGWKECMHEIVKLPLPQSLLGDSDSYRDGDVSFNLASSVLRFIDLCVDRLMLRCTAEDPPAVRKESKESNLSEIHNTNEDEEWPDPVDTLRTSEKNVRQNATRWVFDQLHIRIFPMQPTEHDLALSQCIAKLSWLEPRHLEVADSFANGPVVEHATALLRGLSTHQSPGQMLEALSHAFRSLTESACVLSQAGIVGDSGGEALGADVALPLFILVLLRANPNMLESVLRYIERFTPPQQMLTEAGYAFIQARAATSFAENVRAGHLTNLKPGEWMGYMDTQEHYRVGSFIAGVQS